MIQRFLNFFTQLMTNIQKEIKTIEDNIENVKLKINDSNETLSVKNEKKIEAEDSLKSISDFLKESLEQKNAIHNNLTSLKSSKSSIKSYFISNIVYFSNINC